MLNDPALVRRAPTIWLIGVGVVISLSFSGICASILWKLRDSNYGLARSAATNLVTSIGGQIDRNIELYDLSLHAVIDGLKLPEINTISRELRQVVLFDRAATAKHLGSIWVLDRTGKLIIDSRTLDVPENNYGDRDFFQAHSNRPDLGLFISRPWVTGSGEYLVSFSRRITDHDGLFAGVAVGSMRLSYFHELLGALKLDAQDSVTVVSTEGTILMRTPFDINVIARNIRNANDFSRLSKAESGSFEATSVVDGIERMFVYQRIGSRPLLMIVGLSRNVIFADWRQTAWLVGALLLTLCAVTALLGVSLVVNRRSVCPPTGFQRCPCPWRSKPLPPQRKTPAVWGHSWAPIEGKLRSRCTGVAHRYRIVLHKCEFPQTLSFARLARAVHLRGHVDPLAVKPMLV